jgi:hypothetical protein
MNPKPQTLEPKLRARNLFGESALFGVQARLDDQVVHPEDHLPTPGSSDQQNKWAFNDFVGKPTWGYAGEQNN